MTPQAFFQLFADNIKSRYSGEPHLNHFLTEMEMAFGWMMQNQQVKLFEAHTGSAALFASSVQSNTWSFGFLVLPENAGDATLFWKELVSEAKLLGADKLSGPVNGTTYFPYRLITETDKSPFFRGEYFSETAEHVFLTSQQPCEVNYYRSGYRNTFDGIMAVSKPYYDQAKTNGFQVKTHASVDEQLFQQVFGMVGEIFGGNWSFNTMSPEQAKAFYKHEFGVEQRMALQTLHLHDEMIGFCRYIENDEHTLICKTLGVLPKYQKLGLGNAAVYEMHRCAREAQYTRMIYALIYDGNRVQQNMPKDDSIIFRKYASYEFDLS